MSSPTEGRRATIRDFVQKKARGEKIAVVTAYDALFARLVDAAGVDAILVGDSLGNVIAGLDSTIAVTLDQMIYHATMVRRGAPKALVVIDMPFLTYQVSVEDAMRNCGRAIQETGVQAVKVEGGGEDIAAAVRAVVRLGVPVMGHVGFTPQSVNALGGYRVQGREDAAAQRLVDDARRLEDAGAFGVVLELVPASLAARVTEALTIPTIGIGAGAGCSGQVLVLPDLLGLNDQFSPKFLKRYASMADDVRDAVRRFASDVRDGSYPDADHSF
ncbi:MAG TPA: 3-methyl-2-oxobutanoate hydroxymethyltransferase [Gemmatimonadaceae bacterium]|nr:3-methyl-2-oxobutanoate hydroxymethyltransferase [Gemmatimonadaceae bacterium]